MTRTLTKIVVVWGLAATRKSYEFVTRGASTTASSRSGYDIVIVVENCCGANRRARYGHALVTTCIRHHPTTLSLHDTQYAVIAIDWHMGAIASLRRHCDHASCMRL